ncbi:MAG: hypothetical protein OHK0040_12240 [bacterium]
MHLKLLNPQIMRTVGRVTGKSDINTDFAKAEIGELLKEKEGVLDISIMDKEGRVFFSYKGTSLPKPDFEKYKTTDGIYYKEIVYENKRCLDFILSQQTLGLSNFYIRYIMYFPAIERQMSNINHLLIILALISSLIALFFSYYYAKRITGPLAILEEKAKAIQRGDMEQEIPVLEDEIGELAEALRTMLLEIKKKQNELQLQNERLNESINEVLFLQNQMLNYEKFAALGKISAGMSHEIDNPLGIIIGHAEYLKGELPENSEYHEDIETIIREATRIKGIMRSLLSFAKPKENKIKEINLKEFSKHVLDNFSFQKIFRNIKLNFDADDFTVYADEDKLHQVLVNVILNAIQAMPKGGEITVTLKKSSDFGVISVADTGVGIPEELQNKVFDLFFSTKRDGTGLGLAVTKSFMEEMGGKIELRSKTGEGTTVYLYLPLKNSMGEK